MTTSKTADYVCPVSIRIRRVRDHVIEYQVTAHDPLSGDTTHTYHANRQATFHGPYTGEYSNQVMGAASTLWREDDQQMLLSFQRWFRYAVRDIGIDQ